MEGSSGCSGKHGAIPVLSNRFAQPPPDLEQQLRAELKRLGKDPEKTAAAAPTGVENAAFDLAAGIVDPDGPPDGQGGGLLPSTGVELLWTERLQGDYNQDGLVNTGDLAPLGINWMRQVAYDPAQQHGGLKYWPSGNPDDSGGAAFPDPPAAHSGAANWRLARIDGNGDTQLSLPDISTIAQHWMEQAGGYRVYRRGPDAVDFALLPDPDDSASYWSIPRSSTFPDGEHQPDPTRPVRYRFQDAQAKPGGLGPGVYQYKVVCYDTLSGMEGPLSPIISVTVPADGGGGAPWLTLSATPLEGGSPLQVQFDAEGSCDPDGGALDYSWDWTSDGVYEYFSGADPHGYYTYSAPGTYSPTLKATDNEGLSTLIHATVLVNDGYWVHTWGGAQDDQAVAVALDSKQNVYVAASLQSVEDGADVGVISYTPGGSLRWVKTFGDLDDDRMEKREDPIDIVVTSRDEIVILARTSWLAQQGMFAYNVSDQRLFAIDDMGVLSWQHSWHCYESTYPRNLAIDEADSIYVSVGSSDLIAGVNSSTYIQKYNSTGDLIWQKALTYSGGYIAICDNRIYIAGSVPGNVGSIYSGDKPILSAFDMSGAAIWCELISCAGFASGTAVPMSLTFDNTGSCIISGWGNTDSDVANAFVASVNGAGSAIWGFTWQPDWIAGQSGTGTSSISVDSNGNLLTTVTLQDNEDKAYSSLMKLDGSGNTLSCQAWLATGSNAMLRALTTKQGEKLLLCGQAPSTCGSWSDCSVTTVPGCWSSPRENEMIDFNDGEIGSEHLEATTPVGITDTGGGRGDALIIANPLDVEPAPVQPPEILGISPERAIVNEVCSFRVTLGGGMPSAWSWDFGPNAIPRYSPHPAPGTIFSTLGAQQCSLVLTNSAGSDTFAYNIQVDNPADVPHWRDHVVVATGTSLNASGNPCSAAIIAGRPQIVYLNPYERPDMTTTNYNMYFVSAADSSGTIWNDSITLGQTTNTRKATLISANGFPALSYGRYYRLALDADGMLWTPPQVVLDYMYNATLNKVGGWPVMCYVAGSYIDYYPSTTIDGSSWGPAGSSIIIPNLEPTFYPGILDIAGIPALLIQQVETISSHSSLLFVLGQDALGASWGPLVDAAEDIYYPSDLREAVTLIGGKPAFCVSANVTDAGNDYTSMNLYRALDESGTSWGAPVPICASATCNALKVFNGKPIVIFTVYGGSMWSQQALDAAGTIWTEQPMLVDSEENISQNASLIDLNGVPAVAYTTWPGWNSPNPYSFKIKFAKLY